ncbi:hypothetical protein D3C78_1701280 [compost metagenome]
MSKSEIVARIEELKQEINGFDISEYYSEAEFEELAEEQYGTVEVMGYSYSQISILKECDPIAFREEYNNWLNSLDNDECEAYRDMVEELEELEELESELSDIEEQESEEE